MISEKNKDLFERLCNAMKEIIGIDAMENNRSREVVCARMIIAKILHDNFVTETDIGNLIHKNHSTVHHYLERFNNLSYSGYEAERDMYNKFYESICLD